MLDFQNAEKKDFESFRTTNSGKSTIVEKLLQEMPNATVVHQDYYFLPPGDPRLEPVYIPELDHHNWEGRLF